MKRIMVLFLFFVLSVFGASAQEHRIVVDSKILNTKTEVQVYLLGNEEAQSIVYLTDGGKLLQAGFWEKMKALHEAGKIPSTYLVFVSTVDLNDNRDKRNAYFFCNPDYLGFFEKELLPKVEKTIGKTFAPEQRGLVGVSFGGLNAAWFSANSSSFGKYALLSPVTYPCKKVIESITFSQNENLKIYLSTGKNDAENYVGPLMNIYNTKQYKIHLENTQGGHDFENWVSQLKLIFNFLFGKE